MNGISQEFTALKRMIARYAFVLFSVFAGLLVFPIDGLSYATELFLSAKDSLIPASVPVIALGPVSPFVAPFVMAFLAALLATFPFAILSIVRFLRPALRGGERKALFRYILPALLLFYAGAALAYFMIIPRTFSILYSFAAPMGVEPFFALDDFISSVFLLTISVGFAFLLPVFMAASSRIGIVPPGFWFRHWRGAIVSSIIFSAVVTPDGNGVTMAFLSALLVGLYMVGATVAGTRKRG